jgi:AraC-like DNA-binding protein
MAALTVSAGLARRLIEFAVSAGADRALLARCAGIDPGALEDQDARVPLDRYVALMREGKAQTCDPALGLHYGAGVDMAEFSVVGLLFQACETIAESLVQINRYGQLIIEVELEDGPRFPFVRRGDQLWLVDARRDPNAFPELTEATFARFISMTRPFSETPIVLEVHVTHQAPAHAAEYRRVFGAPTRFGCEWNAMRLEEAALTRRIQVQPRYAFGILSEHAEALLKSLEGTRTMRGQVERLLMPLLHTGTAGMELVAERLGMSRQTLFRRLRAEDTSFEKVLDELRRQLALHYLSGGKVSVNETAFLVGFSDPAAFSRAFKRWTGRSPGAFRASGQSG